MVFAAHNNARQGCRAVGGGLGDTLTQNLASVGLRVKGFVSMFRT